jgi:hypothetical protein
MLLSAAAMAQPASRPDLYGTWKLDAASSQWGPLAATQGAIFAGTLSIEKHHKTLHMALTVKFDHGDRTDEMDWRVDDKYHPVNGPASGEILAKWEGAVLVGERENTNSHDSIRFRASEDGSVLTETVHHKGSDGTWDSTLMWKKQ